MKVNLSLVCAVTKDYVPYALTVMRSARENADFLKYYVFVSDVDNQNCLELQQTLGEDANWINWFCPDNLNDQLKQCQYKSLNYYNGFELSQQSKYIAVKHVLSLQDGSDWIVFSDSDTCFFSSISDIFEAAHDKSVILTPHIYQAEEDEQREHETMVHGWINTGLSAYKQHSSAALKLLDWMISRTSSRGFLAPQLGLSGDQTWGSALPYLFKEDVHIDMTPGLNVAYWNLHERTVTLDANKQFLVNGKPLKMFHFSGYDYNLPTLISKHISSDKSVLSESSALYPVFNNYQQRLKAIQPLITSLAKINKLKTCSLSLESRIKISNKYVNDSRRNLYITGFQPGFFKKLGRIWDAMFNK